MTSPARDERRWTLWRSPLRSWMVAPADARFLKGECVEVMLASAHEAAVEALENSVVCKRMAFEVAEGGRKVWMQRAEQAEAALAAARQADEAWDLDAARAAGNLLATAGDALIARLWQAVRGAPTNVSLHDVQTAWSEAKERVELLPYTRPDDLIEDDPALLAALTPEPEEKRDA